MPSVNLETQEVPHKDRAIARMLLTKIKKGEITDDSIILEYTTGSAGISVAKLCQLIGLRAHLVMPENITEERAQIIQGLNAELTLTPRDQIISPQDSANGLTENQIWIRGAVKTATQILASDERYVLLGQSGNPENKKAFHGLGQELDIAFGNQPLDYFVSAVGTGATLMGTAEYLRHYRPQTKIIGIDPVKSASTWAALSGKSFAHHPHVLYGTGPGQASPIVIEGIRNGLVDEVAQVDDLAVYERAKELKKAGLPVGPTSAASIMVGEDIVRKEPNSKIAIILYDLAERYASIGL